VGRIEETFARASREKKRVLVAYLCVGDPSADESVELAVSAVRAGADILELGVPFSDPTADGPAIARASERALAKGGGLDASLAVAARIRERTEAPIVLFGYYNPLFVRGEARIVEDAARAGVDALLIVDLPVEESGSLRALGAAHGVAVIPLLAPTSGPSRIEAVRRAAEAHPSGFLYYVSLTGVTGSQDAPLADASRRAAELRAATGLPTVVGFGIDSADKARAAGLFADGVVVGTALVKAIERAPSASARLDAVTALVAELRRGLDRDREPSPSLSPADQPLSP
jgi:tryptophan synthase alpha chain